ncbi:MAG: hypothetical protein RLZ35_778 [Pseudomonadota bacterium]
MNKLIGYLLKKGLYPYCFIAVTTVAILSSAFAQERNILVVGDSLSAGYGIAPEKTWVSLLSERLAEKGYPFVVVNKSVSGSTTQSGVDRLSGWLEEVHPKYTILALGSNDGLRGQPITLTKKNLEKMVNLSEEKGAKVILVGFMIPPNYGQEYSDAFKEVFSVVAKEKDLPFVPFLLEGMATEKKYFQADGLHPNEDAQPILLNNVWSILEPVLNN